ncbi:polysaccharide biosynthesis tyrosine autokinase [Glaciihabitans sp. dw_435]|uniref:polysaccharide biosynthesis tyrosine autokinase n=1 Tax=Glaciihabitans sp. dw_435 TaxID=2720081 RepID=UPI001BD2E877|nr:polysaccharide biosynthesis tyrosine autokinase [Glaciihabitans sp. dw_435]
MELSDYLRILRKRWIVIVALTLVGLAAAAAATILTTPKYEASTLSFVNVSGSSVTDLATGGTFAQNQVKSYADLIGTPRVLDPAIKRLGLDISAEQLAKSVSASAALQTVNIAISVVDDSPTDAAAIANAVTSSFREQIADITEPATGTSQVSVSVMQQATVPTAPISPNTQLNLVLGLLIGLALGLGISILRETLDTRIRGERDVLAITSAPIIGGIAYDPAAVKRPLIVQDDPHSVRAEAFRTLRTNLQFLNVEAGPKTFVITSSIPSEGKTTTSANLAIALADSGAKVVIIDGDMRRPKLADYMGIEGAVGLSDVLISRVELADVLQPWGRGNLMVLAAGAVPPNPSELLGSKAMAALLSDLEAHFDVVIIDLPPLLPVTDAALVSKLTRGALVVVAAGRTHKGELAGAIAALENVGAPVAGVILTMMPTKGPDAYGYGRYGYGNYGYTRYGEEGSGVNSESAAAAKKLAPDWGQGPSSSL